MNIRVLLLIVALFILFLLLTSMALFKGSRNSSQPNTTIPVFSPSPSPSSSFVPTPAATSSTTNTGYTGEGLNQNYQRTSSSVLSPADQAVFSKMTASLDGNSDIITTAPTFQIEYVNPPNEFLVEIFSNNADQGKQDAVTYLEQQGFSAQGICSLKMVIYLSQDDKNYYQQNNLEFNPVPNGC